MLVKRIRRTIINIATLFIILNFCITKTINITTIKRNAKMERREEGKVKGKERKERERKPSKVGGIIGACMS